MEAKKIVLTAIMICFIIITTMFFKIPIPFANGYVHLGDAMVFLSVLILGTKQGALAAAIGSALGDVMGGFAIWAPWTLVIKGVMALILGAFILKMTGNGRELKLRRASAIQAIGMLFAGLWMTFGYFVAESIMYSWVIALIGIPWNIGQFALGMAIATAAAASLSRIHFL